MGAVSLSATKKNDVIDNKRVVECDVTFSSSYSTGGDSVSLPALGLKTVTDLTAACGNDLNGQAIAAGSITGIQVQLAGTAQAPLLKLYNGAATEATAASNNSTKVIKLRFWGTA